jgi:hypothetical protein
MLMQTQLRTVADNHLDPNTILRPASVRGFGAIEAMGSQMRLGVRAGHRAAERASCRVAQFQGIAPIECLIVAHSRWSKKRPPRVDIEATRPAPGLLMFSNVETYR